jgi:hypothetical protein
MRIRRIDSDALLDADYEAERSVLTVQFESGSI